jgi:hypothetical protein
MRREAAVAYRGSQVDAMGDLVYTPAGGDLDNG